MGGKVQRTARSERCYIYVDMCSQSPNHFSRRNSIGEMKIDGIEINNQSSWSIYDLLCVLLVGTVINADGKFENAVGFFKKI